MHVHVTHKTDQANLWPNHATHFHLLHPRLPLLQRMILSNLANLVLFSSGQMLDEVSDAGDWRLFKIENSLINTI